MRIEILAPLIRGRKGEFRDLFEKLRKDGFVRARVDGETYDLVDPPSLNRYENHDIAVVVDRLVVKTVDRDRIADSVETALRAGDGVIEVLEHGKGRTKKTRRTRHRKRKTRKKKKMKRRAMRSWKLLWLLVRANKKQKSVWRSIN